MTSAGTGARCACCFPREVGPSGRVVTFEPMAGPADDLEHNVALNGCENVRLIRAAASDAEGTAAFDFPEGRDTQGKLRDVEPTYEHGSAAALEVPTVTLDGVVRDGERPPDLLKIDVEGAAAAVLRGARRLLEERGPAVFLELHGPEERAGVRDELLSRGYRVGTPVGEPVADPMTFPGNTLWCVRG